MLSLTMTLKEHTSTFNTITVGILITIISGLVLFLFSFFNDKFPQVETRIRVLEEHSRIRDNKIDQIDDKIDKIYQILIEKNSGREK